MPNDLSKLKRSLYNKNNEVNKVEKKYKNKYVILKY